MKVGEFLKIEHGGFFGSIGIKKIEAIKEDWIVVRDFKTNEISLLIGSKEIKRLKQYSRTCIICSKCNGEGIIKD